jgi:hypothetical protein
MQDEIYLKKHEIFEKKLMDMLLAGEQELFVKLRKQYEVAIVTDREFTGHGFFTGFKVPGQSLSIDNRSFTLYDVGIDYNGEEPGCGVTLFIENGFIECLEGYTFTDNWIEDYDRVGDVYYAGGTPQNKLHKRSIHYLNKILQKAQI